jgi:hypothetical protein
VLRTLERDVERLEEAVEMLVDSRRDLRSLRGRG